MCSVCIISIFLFVGRASVELLATNHTGKMWHSTKTSLATFERQLERVTKNTKDATATLVDHVVDDLLERVLRVLLFDHTHLCDRAPGKLGHIAIPPRMSFGPTISRRSFRCFKLDDIGFPRVSWQPHSNRMARPSWLGCRLHLPNVPIPDHCPVPSAVVYPESDPKVSRLFNFDFLPRFGTTLLPAILSPMLGTIGVSVFAIWLQSAFGFPGFSQVAHQMLGTAVSLLMVFRTQLAYGRYWEGCGHLDMLMAAVADMASMASVLLKEEAEGDRAELARLLRMYASEAAAFLRTASYKTRRESNYWLPEEDSGLNPFTVGEAKECDFEATDRERALLRSSARPPILVLQWLRALFASFQFGSRMDRMEVQLQVAWIGCKKIATMPPPQPYTRLSRSLLFMFVFTLPFVLVRSFARQELVVIAATMLLTFGYYGLDYCANQLQNPFIAELGCTQLDGRFVQAACKDIDMLLLWPSQSRQNLKQHTVGQMPVAAQPCNLQIELREHSIVR